MLDYYRNITRNECVGTALKNCLIALGDRATAHVVSTTYRQHPLVNPAGLTFFGVTPVIVADVTNGRYRGRLQYAVTENAAADVTLSNLQAVFGRNAGAILRAYEEQKRCGQIIETREAVYETPAILSVAFETGADHAVVLVAPGRCIDDGVPRPFVRERKRISGVLTLEKVPLEQRLKSV